MSDLRDLEAKSLSPGLYIVATPIGNLGDVTLRAVDVLARCDAIACEDTRVTRKLLQHLGLSKPLWRYDDHASEEDRSRLLVALRDKAVALVSDAGTPLVSDPGYRLVREARAAGIAVTSLPGPSAPVMALTLSGLPTDRFLFAGFLPAKDKARGETLAELAGAIDVPPAALEATVARFNEGAARGEDPEFGRGSFPYDRFIGDLGPLEEPPFYAFRVLPGCLGTKGGPRTDPDGRVLSVLDGEPIRGLYAAGNVAASPFGLAYPGAGGTLGPALVFGVRAGEAAAGD